MKILLLCSAWLATAAVPAAAQQSYSWEISGSELTSDAGPSDSDATAIGAVYYFDPIDEGEAPYALAAFLDPATRVSAALTRTTVTLNGTISPAPVPIPSLENNTDALTVNGRYLLPRSQWYAGGRYNRDETDGSLDAKNEGYGVVAGKYLGPRTTLELALETVERESTQTFSNVSQTSIAKSDSASLSFVHVRRFRALTYVLSGGLAQFEQRLVLAIPSAGAPGIERKLDPVRTYALQTAFYPTRRLGVQVGYQTSRGDPSRSDAYSVGARWFLRRNVAFELLLSRQARDLPPPNEDIDTRSFRIVGRL
jgi:hypothetical protein